MKQHVRKEKKQKKASLSGKMSLILGGASVAVFTVMSLAIISFGEKAISNALDNNLQDKVVMATGEMEEVLYGLETVSNNIEEGISFIHSQHDLVGGVPGNPYKSLDENGNANSTTPMTGTTFHSRVFDIPLPASRYNAEVVMLDSLYSALKTNAQVLGAGIFFSPGGFHQDIQDYSLFMTKKGIENREVSTYSYESYKDSEWFTNTQETKDMEMMEVHEDPDYPDQKIITLSNPILNDQKNFVGNIILDIDTDVFSSVKQEDSRFPTLFTNVMDDDTDILFSMNPAMIGKNMADVAGPASMEKIKAGIAKGEPFMVAVPNSKGEVRRAYFRPVNVHGAVWWTMLGISQKEFMAARDQLVLVCLAFSVAGLVALILITWVMIRRSLKPLQSIALAGKKVSEGDFDIQINYTAQDEIGDLSQAISNVITRIKDIISDLSVKLEELSKGNFRIENDHPEYYTGAYQPLMESLKEITDTLDSTMGEIKESAVQVNSGAEQVSSAAQNLSQGATEQASSIEELSATMNDISGKIKETARTTQEASRLSNLAGQSVMLSNDKMKEMSLAMKEITEKSQEIGKIIKTIDDIAFQTNILSLNAAIEAARAGAAGKGFAVVADEVGNLAQKSAKAAQNTSELIEETIEAVNKGVRISGETAESLSEVVLRAGKINDLIADVSRATEEQSQGVSQVTLGIDQISSVVQTNSATAEQSAAASEELSGQANILNDLVNRFQLKNED